MQKEQITTQTATTTNNKENKKLIAYSLNSLKVEPTAMYNCKNRIFALTQVGLQLHYQTMCKQVDQLNLLDHYRSQASVKIELSHVVQVATTGMLKVQLHL